MASEATGGTQAKLDSLAASAAGLTINEVLASHVGTDTGEFVELHGPARMSLAGLSLIVVEGDAGQQGAIDRRIDFGADDAIGDNGFFLIGNPTGLPAGVAPDIAIGNDFFENSSLTVMLVETASLSGTTITGAEMVVDSLGLSDGGVGDTFYGEGPVFGPDGSFFPAGARRVADGVDTDSVSDWTLADFNLTANTPTAAAFFATPLINEFSASTAGTDVEYVEILVTPGASLAGWWLLEIEGDAGAAAGTVDGAFDLSGLTVDADGIALLNLPANELENGTITLMLVQNFTGALGVDLDADNDGVFDVTPWDAVADDVAVHDGGAGDITYSATVLGVAYDGLPFAPGGASRIPEGTDTDSAADWVRNDFDLAGIDGFDGTPEAGEALNTPGAPNQAVGGGGPVSLVINEIFADPAGDISGDANGDGTRDASADEFIEILNTGTSTADLSGMTIADAVAVRHVFAVGTELAAGERIVVFGGGVPTGGFGGAQVVVASTGMLSLNNAGDTVTLADGATVLDAVTYGAEGGADVSLTRVPDGSGGFVQHSTIPGAGAYSPGTEAGGGGGEPQPVLISAIQGDGAASAMVGQLVTVEAIVVGDFQGASRLNGFFLQEEDADSDGNALTSEGIFVADGSAASVDVASGDLVRVTGTVSEANGRTQLTGVTVEVVSSGNALPTAAEVAFPVASIVNNSGTLVADLEAYEGMLVTIPQEMTVTDVFTLGRFGEIDLSASGPVPTFTQVNAPSVAGYEAYLAEAARNSIVLDDGSDVQNPSAIPFEIAGEPGRIAGEFDAEDELGSGDTVSGLTGIMDYGFGQYRVQPVETPQFENANPREETPPDVGGSLKVATFNVLNYFTTLLDEGLTSGPTGQEPRGADNLDEFLRQTDKLIAALGEIRADVFGLLEIENEFGDQNGDGEFAIATLVATLNQATGMSYAFIDPGTGYLGGDAISVGLIYNSQTVRLADDTSVAFLTDADLAGLGLDFGHPVFEGEGSSRVPLAASFEQIGTGEVFTVAVNHFKSKGSASPWGDNADKGDGAGASNEARLQAAIALDAWLDTDPTGSGDSDVMIVGDLNSYAMEDPIQYLLGQGYVNPVGTGAYSYGFPLGNAVPQSQGFGTLDYALVSASLAAQLAGAAVWNINADEASTLDYNTNFKPADQVADHFAPDPFRSSDHDPVLVGLDLQSRDLVLGSAGSDVLTGTDADEIIDALGGRSDTVRGLGGSDVFRFADIAGQRDALTILDYTPGEDLIDLAGNALVGATVLGGNLRLLLDGGDGDYILLRGVDDLGDVTFTDDPFAVA